MQREYKISLSQEYYSDVVYLSQYDDDYDVIFHVINKYSAADVGGKSAKFTGTRSDGLGFTFNAVAVGSSVSFHINTSLTACAGTHTAEIVFYDSNDLYFGSANVQVIVEKAAHPEGTIDADEEQLRELAAQVQEIVDTAAAEVKGEAESWAVGQRDGVDVPSTDPAYENNAKYYAEQAQDIADSIGIDATLSISGKAADAKKTGDEISDLKEDLTAVNPLTNLVWTLKKSIDNTGAEFSSNVCADTDYIPCDEGDIFVCNNADKDTNNKWFIGFLVLYKLENGIYTFVSRNTFTKGTKITIPSTANAYRIVFGRQSSSGVTITTTDIATYASYEIYQKSAPLKAFSFPFGQAFQTSLATEVLKVTSVLSDSNRVYTLADNKPSETWYTSFACKGINYQTTNNSSYTTKYLVPLAALSSASINRYRLVCLCINIGTMTFVFKEAQDITVNDYVVQMFTDGRNVTPWYSPAFTDSGIIADALKPILGLAIQGNRTLAEENVLSLGTSVSGSSMTYVISDAKPSTSWYITLLVDGTTRQITNNASDTGRTVFNELTLTASRYHLVALTIRKPNFEFSLKDTTDLNLNDYVVALFFNGQNVTPWSETLFVQPSVAFEHYVTKPDYLTRNLYKIFKKVGCIGDSWTAGYLDSGSHIYGRSDGYAWTDYMETHNTEWVNGGYSGAMTSTYLTDDISSNGGGHLAIEDAGQCQAYIIGLGFNDSRPVASGGLTLGTSADIGDTTKDTFYSWYSRIVEWAIALNTDAFIFCQTMYPPLNNGETDFASRFAPYNTAIRDIVAYYQANGNNKIRLLDLEVRADLYAALGRGWDVNGSHHGCVGYEFLAECLKSVLGDELAEHPDLYHNIREIPYTT